MFKFDYLEVSEYIVFDLETTGTAEEDEIIEIAAIKVKDGEEVDYFSTLVKPQIPIRNSIVHGIDDSMVQNMPPIEEVIPPFLKFVGNNTLVGHNIVRFDIPFLNKILRRMSLSPYGKDSTMRQNVIIDTLPISRYILKLDRFRLVDLKAHYGIVAEREHRSLDDCKVNRIIFENLKKEENPSPSQNSCQLCDYDMREKKVRGKIVPLCINYPDCPNSRRMARP